MLDESNPRSIAHQLATLKARANALPRATPAQSRGRDREIIDAIYARLKSFDVNDLTRTDAKGARPALRDLVETIQNRLADLSNEYAESWFRLVSRRRSGAAPRHRTPTTDAA